MGNINNDNWMVTFSYEQELRSKYMNGLLNGGFHPGVYNANISLYTVGGSTNPDEYDGIFAYIKKGTTLIFSNNYIKINNDHYERNLDEIGSYLIKATANNDMNIPLITWSNNSPGLAIDKLGFLENERAHQHYLMAKLEYDPESKKVTRPYIFLTDKNEEWYKYAYTPPIPKEYSTYFKPPKVENGANTIKSNFTIPDGTKSFFEREFDILPQISWLCLGIINEKPVEEKILASGPISKNNYIISYLESKSGVSTPIWLNRSDAKNYVDTGDSLWLRQHSFTGRGLPEYRYSLSYNSRSQSPDFFIENVEDKDNKSISNNLYLDLKGLNTGNNIINKENNLYSIYGIGPGQSPENKENFPKADYTFTLKSNQKSLDNKIYEKLKNSLEELHSPKLTLCDLLFLSIPGTMTNTDPTMLPFDNLNQDVFIENLLKQTSSNGDNPYRVLSFRCLTNIIEGNLSPNADSENQFLTYLGNPASASESGPDGFKYPLTHTGYFSPDIKGKVPINQRLILPLDVSTTNFDRLVSIIKNSNVVAKVISYMREHSLIPADVGSLIPICIAFRKFGKALVADNKNPMPKKENLTNVKTISMDGYSSLMFVNPANVLNFFDLNYKVTPINTIDLKYENTYSVLPIIV